MEELKGIKVNMIYGEENRTTSLKAYKAESELKREVKRKQFDIERYFYAKHRIPIVVKVKLADSNEKEEYSLIELINSKLTNTTASVCLETYEIFKTQNIEKAIESLHLQSNLTII